MRKLTLAAGLIVAVILTVVWLEGWFDWLIYQSFDVQRSLQNTLAGAIRQLKAGQSGAVFLLVALCFGYGVVHAIGPGHGKMLIGSYALSNRVSARRLIIFALASSLAQAAVAVGLVYAGVLLFAWSRDQMTDMAERSMTAASYLIIGAIGLYLALRGLRTMVAARRHAVAGGHALQDHGHSHTESAQDSHPHGADPHPAHAGHSHSHSHGPAPHSEHDDHSGHAHGPSLAEIEQVRGWRDGLMLVAGVAVRPCSGALLVLLLCWRIGNDAAGIAGTFAMGLGTAVITIIAALLAATMREGAWATGLDTNAMRWVAGGLGVAAGLVLVLTSALLVRPYL